MLGRENKWTVSWLGVFAGAGLLAGLPVAAAESIIRCQLPDGRVSFSDRPCRSGIQDKLEFEDRKVGWEAPRTPLKLKRRSKRERQQQARRKATMLRTAKKERARKKKDCWKKRAKADQIQERLRRGYKAGQGRTMRYKQREIDAYLREFCR